ncbi:NUDIX hydrolase [Neogemmobacter tilapiae]|uniref:NUDIX domain-containing protein n=1 Tax=Neogemmobacter tilapiae TaxID=875041 RepID=A0A918TJL0_9RHOB|nr:NUDIX hydrolase [Gemmobacter tilapiae]GHC49989.1 NUDIX domain-containing protein [Gemmobacter tilapiae]
MTDETFHGAKLALLHQDQVLTYLRDDFAHIPFPGHWDFPGGGRENSESPSECVLRETFEEFGLNLPPERLIFSRQFNWTHKPNHRVWFFGGYLTAAEIAAIRFGDEGQHWRMMDIAEFLAHPLAIPDLKHRLSVWLDERLSISPQP